MTSLRQWFHSQIAALFIYSVVKNRAPVGRGQHSNMGFVFSSNLRGQLTDSVPGK